MVKLSILMLICNSQVLVITKVYPFWKDFFWFQLVTRWLVFYLRETMRGAGDYD